MYSEKIHVYLELCSSNPCYSRLNCTIVVGRDFDEIVTEEKYSLSKNELLTKHVRNRAENRSHSFAQHAPSIALCQTLLGTSVLGTRRYRKDI